jgi:methylenetetrahydrofolate dehydrogenase (NADP+) / methenyltetrahydrofolate cyclohydrolase / formyltetrahydrofolate synthetase
MDPKFHGIIVQMPLDSSSKINSHLITDSVSSEKDVDGLNTINEGKIAVGDLSGLLPCTPNGNEMNFVFEMFISNIVSS